MIKNKYKICFIYRNLEYLEYLVYLYDIIIWRGAIQSLGRAYPPSHPLFVPMYLTISKENSLTNKLSYLTPSL